MPKHRAGDAHREAQKKHEEAALAHRAAADKHDAGQHIEAQEDAHSADIHADEAKQLTSIAKNESEDTG